MKVNNSNERTSRFKAAGITILLHLVLILILMYSVLHTPIPPMGSGDGLIVNIGYADIGTGDIQPQDEVVSDLPQPQKAHHSYTPQEEEKVVTQENEATASITVHKEKKDVKKNEPDPTETKKETPTEAVNKVNPAAIYKGRHNNAASQGTGNGQQGDQGSPNGDPNSDQYGASGDGGGGRGGSGGGVSFSLGGRKLITAPSIDDRSQETGKVVVEITVDKAGRVTRARAGARGSTTTNATLYAKAEQAALKAKFNAMENQNEEQRGTITFVFLLK